MRQMAPLRGRISACSIGHNGSSICPLFTSEQDILSHRLAVFEQKTNLLKLLQIPIQRFRERSYLSHVDVSVAVDGPGRARQNFGVAVRRIN